VIPLLASETAAAATSAALNWHTLFFVFFAMITCGFALAVLFTSNIVRMAFYLTICLGSASGLFFLAGSEFIGAMQFMIYVGGTLVLLIFGVMLTAQQRFISMETSAGEWVLAAIIGSALLLLLVRSAASVEAWNTPRDPATLVVEDGKNAMPIGLALSGVRVDKLDEPNASLRFGKSGYLLPFVIVSMHLLVVLIGAGYMARTKRQMKAVATPAAVRPDRQFSFPILAGIIKGWIVSLLAAFVCFAGLLRGYPPAGEKASLVEQVLGATSAWPAWLLPTLGILFLVNALLLWVVYSWQKWGVVGLVLMPFIEGLCFVNAGLVWWLAPVVVVLAIAPVMALTVLLCSGRPSPWSQMD
jgi:NADH:ubiquinone oxidoreductase subunit 6 (subunit J)